MIRSVGVEVRWQSSCNQDMRSVQAIRRSVASAIRFHPTEYVDITDTHALKLKSLACHASQNIIGSDGNYTPMMYDCGHPAMEDFRGKELGVHAAEAFTKMTGRGMGKLIL